MHLSLLSVLCVCVCVSSRREAILLPPLPIPSLAEREPKDARPECPPHAIRQQPVPGHQGPPAGPRGARDPATLIHPTTMREKTNGRTVVGTDHCDQDSGKQSGNKQTKNSSAQDGNIRPTPACPPTNVPGPPFWLVRLLDGASDEVLLKPSLNIFCTETVKQRVKCETVQQSDHPRICLYFFCLVPL